VSVGYRLINLYTYYHARYTDMINGFGKVGSSRREELLLVLTLSGRCWRTGSVSPV